MELKKLLAVAVAAAFAVPLAAQASADGDRLILAQASGASSVGTGPTGAPASPQSAGEPKAPTAGSSSTAGSTTGSTAGSTAAGSSMSRSPDFSAIDKNSDGQISRAEWDAYHRSGSAATGGATTAPSAVGTPPGQTGTTAGPGSASPRTAPSSDTATSPGTSGQGKPQ